MTDRADGFVPREEIPDRRSSSTLVARGKNARMMRAARVIVRPRRGERIAVNAERKRPNRLCVELARKLQLR
jgi:ABC-type uncharacterized transport system auxiliary subunit